MMMDYYDIEAINQYLQARVNEVFLVCYNHPYWSMQTHENYSKLRNIWAMEIYNHCSEISDGYYGYTPQVFDEMLRTGNKLFCVSVDDNHNQVNDSFGGFIVINAADLQYGSVIEAMKQGDFYSSQGPDIYEISIKDGKLLVKCSEVELIVVYTDSRVCYLKKEIGMTEAEFDISGDEGYIRIMCRDKNKRDANSNAYWI